MEEWFMMAAAGSVRALGLDFGAKTVGVSAADALGVTAQGLEIIRRKSENKLRQTLARIDELARERSVEVIVLGLPRTMGGKLSERTYRTLKFGEMVQKRTNLPVVYWDERLTIVAADRTMQATAVAEQDRKTYVDEIAAMLILQGYLDCVHHSENVPETDAEALIAAYESEHSGTVA